MKLRVTRSCNVQAALFLLLGSMLAPVSAFAETVIEEVVVTARQREEKLTDVPASGCDGVIS